MIRRKYKFLVVIAIILLASLMTIFLSRGWIRETLIPNYFTTSAKTSLDGSYQDSYESSLSFVEDLGLDGINSIKTADCRLFGAEGVSTKVSCYVGSGDSFTPSMEYKEFFKNNSNKIEESLLANGWTKTWNQNQPIEELFDNADNNYSIGVNYVKNDPKECTLKLSYNAWQEPDNFKYSLSCVEYITYF